MELKLHTKHKSIESLICHTLPDFTVITGLNGSGKTQILEAIANGAVRIDGLKRNERLFNFFSPYRIANMNLGSARKIDWSNKEQPFYTEINNSYNQPTKKQFQIIKKKYEKVFDDNFEENGMNHILDLKPIYDESLTNNVFNYKIAQIIYDYEYRKENNDFEKYKRDKGDEHRFILETDEFLSFYGEHPVQLINDILTKAKLKIRLLKPNNTRDEQNYMIKFTNLDSNSLCDYRDLSSGEKIILSFAFAFYNKEGKYAFPDVLLLDEPDSSLHPSLTKNLIDMISEIFINENIKVIMTTHSPSTVSLVKEESLYFISNNSSGHVIERTAKDEAISQLTEGLIVVNKNMKYVYVEANDDRLFFSKAYELAIRFELIDNRIPLLFIPASLSNDSGGCEKVRAWVREFNSQDIRNMFYGIIDLDKGQLPESNLRILRRYSIENYLCDPVILFSLLEEKRPKIPGLDIHLGEECKIKELNDKQIQNIADTILIELQKDVRDIVINTDKISVSFNGSKKTIHYPSWLLSVRGHDFEADVKKHFGKKYSYNLQNIKTRLLSAFERTGLIPDDLIDIFKSIQYDSDIQQHTINQ